jgi:hypothetical protein
MLLAGLLAALAVTAAEDPWKKVRELKSGTEIRVIRQGGKPPLVAKFADATEESLVVVVKNEQLEIPKREIDRVDARPGPRRVTKETKSTEEMKPDGMSKGWSSGTSVTTPAFETIYRRTAASPQR